MDATCRVVIVGGGFGGLYAAKRLGHAPVSLTLIKPSAVDTPYKDHARNLTGAPIKNPPPVYATPLVAQAILYAAEHRVRELNVGAGGQFLALLGMVAPMASEPLIAFATPSLNRDEAAKHRPASDNLHHAGQDLRERSFYPHVRESSLYSAAQMRPKATLSLFLLAAVATGVAFHLGQKRPAAAAAPAPVARRRRVVNRKPL